MTYQFKRTDAETNRGEITLFVGHLPQDFQKQEKKVVFCYRADFKSVKSANDDDAEWDALFATKADNLARAAAAARQEFLAGKTFPIDLNA